VVTAAGFNETRQGLLATRSSPQGRNGSCCSAPRQLCCELKHRVVSRMHWHKLASPATPMCARTSDSCVSAADPCAGVQ